MKIKISQLIANFLVENQVTDVFMITGGGAMHLNDAIGHHSDLKCTYNHHEQACAIAAEGYARLTGRIAAVCVTSGPGGTNAITGVVGAWQDSIPMFVVSGQVKRETTTWSTDVPLRQLGDQEFQIVDMVANTTKYAVMVTEPNDILYHLQKAWFLANNGRKGPVWLDIPLDVQAAMVETDELRQITEAEMQQLDQQENPVYDKNLTKTIYEKITSAKRPVILGGTGINVAGARDEFLELAELLNVPVVTAWNAHDIMPTDHPLFVGKPGTVGTRPGNFVVQSADLLLVLGCRMNIRIISYNRHQFAQDAEKIVVDIDANELKKPTVNVDVPVHADVKEVLTELIKYAKENAIKISASTANPASTTNITDTTNPASTTNISDATTAASTTNISDTANPASTTNISDTTIAASTASPASTTPWLTRCKTIYNKYPAVLPEYHNDGSEDKPLNPYVFTEAMFNALDEGDTVVTGNGGACVIGFQASVIKKNQRLFTNSGCAAMGYGFPAALGAAVARKDNRTICFDGDGSFMMNLQELQTVVYNNLNLKIVILNNNGYHSIRQTQTNLFKGNPLIGVCDGNGVSFPDFEKVAMAFDIPYTRIDSEKTTDGTITDTLKRVFATDGPQFIEAIVDPAQNFEPKLSSKVHPDGTITSPPLDDMFPFLPEEEYAQVKKYLLAE